MIIFFGYSIYHNSNQGGENARTLIDFAKTSVEEIDQNFTEINSTSLVGQASPENYDKLTGKLDVLSKKLQNYAATVPNKNTDSSSLKLEKSLKDFYLNTKSKIIEKYIEKYTTEKTLLTDYTVYGQLKTNVSSGLKKDVLNSVESGTKTINFESKYATLSQDSKTQANILKNAKEDLEKLSQVKTLLDPISTDNLSAQQIDSIKNIYKDAWPVENHMFPKILITDLKSKDFIDNITQLQTNINAVAKQYSL